MKVKFTEKVTEKSALVSYNHFPSQGCDLRKHQAYLRAGREGLHESGKFVSKGEHQELVGDPISNGCCNSKNKNYRKTLLQ